MPGVTYKEVIKKIKKRGFVLRRQAKGSHEIWENGFGVFLVVPNHSGDLATGTVNKIIKLAGFKNLSEFKSFR